MKLGGPTKVIGGAILTVVLGAIGSGVWEHLLSPAWSWAGRTMLTIITLGIDSASDSVYATVALGHTERFSLLTYTFVTMLLVAVPILALVFYKLETSEKKSERERRWRAMRAAGDHAGMKSALAEMDRMLVRLRKAIRGLLWIMLSLSVVLLAKSLSMSYANGAISHFNQSLMIVGPYLSESEEKVMNSDFARIASKSDYVNLMKRIESKASEHGVKLTEFTVW